jgi:type IX secretion system PorP/SprF family membrane protein
MVAQSDFDLSQRWFNEAVYNPAATGNTFSSVGVCVHSRAQWLNTEGAPITNAVTVDGYFDKINSAAGLVVLTDKIGYISSWSAKFNYAYYIGFEHSSLSVGLSGYLINRNKRLDPSMSADPSDPALSYSHRNDYSPDFDFGLEFKGPFKAGIAARHLLSSQSVNSLHPSYDINLWGYISSRFELSNTGTVSLEPVLSGTLRKNIYRVEGGLIAYFHRSSDGSSNLKKNEETNNDKFWLGGMFQYKDQVSLLGGVYIFPQLALGYSFNYGITELSSLSKIGTHEIYLSWRLGRKSYKKDCCPAYKSCK